MPPPSEPRVREGVRAVLPLALGPALFGASFGVLAESSGMGAAATIVMSATTFGGSSQFAAASVLETGGSAAAAILAAVFLNARYVAMSIAVASIFPGGRVRRLASSQLIVDESWALSGRSGRFQWQIAALFLALAFPYMRERRALQAAALAAAITLVLLPVAPAGVPIVAASLACLLGLRR